MTSVCDQLHNGVPSPVLFTLAFPGKHEWCPRCGKLYDHYAPAQLGEAEPLPPELEQRAARYLFAVQCSNRDRVKMGGKWVKVQSLPAAIRRENSEVIKNWRYEICVTQS